MKTKIEINAEDTIALVEGVEVAIKEIHGFDYAGQEMTTLHLEDGREFESYDDCQTWIDLT